MKGPLLRAVKAARGTESITIETTYGNMEGFKADAVTKLVIAIVESLRYVEAIGTLQLFIGIYRDEPNDDIRQQILNAVEKLSEYNIDAYNQVGPMLQMALVDHLAGTSDHEVDSIRPIALIVWTEAIQSDITGTKWKADSVVLRTGALPASDQLREVRDKVIKALFAAYDRSTDDAQKRTVLSALDAATRTPNQAQYSNELLATTLKDAPRIVDFVTERAKAASYELRSTWSTDSSMTISGRRILPRTWKIGSVARPKPRRSWPQSLSSATLSTPMIGLFDTRFW